MQNSITSSNQQIVVLKIALTLIFFTGLLLASDYFAYQGSDSLKYFIPYTVTLIFVIFLIYSSFSYTIKNYFILFCAALPILVWGGSVLIPFISGEYWPLASALLVIFCIFRSVATNERKSLSRSEIIFWLLLFSYFGGRMVIYSIESILLSKFNTHIFINWCLSPFLFCFFVFSVRKRHSQEATGKIILTSLTFLFITTIVITITEIVTRGQNFGLSFLLHGANGGYSSTEGDVTGGHGEPLVLGMSAAFGAILAVHAKNYKALLIMMVLAIFCMSLRPMLVVVVIAGTLILSISKRKHIATSITVTLISVVLSLLYQDVILAKFMGVNSSSATLDYGNGISVGYNIVFYFRGLQWAQYVDLEITPWIQIFLSPFVGGNEGIPFFQSGFLLLPFVVGTFKVAVSAFLILLTIKRKQFKLVPALGMFFLLICYLDPFQALYRDTLEGIKFGSTPRESPSYFFILYISAAFYLLQSKQLVLAAPSTQQLISAIKNK